MTLIEFLTQAKANNAKIRLLVGERPTDFIAIARHYDDNGCLHITVCDWFHVDIDFHGKEFVTPALRREIQHMRAVDDAT